jgi:hypothetical protein
MGTSLSFDEAQRVLVVRFEGTLTDEVARLRYRQLATWFVVHGYCSNVTDFSGLTSFTVTTRTIRELAANAPLVPNGYLRIIVAPQDSVFGLGRMYEMLGSGTRDMVHVVRTIAQAYELLGVEHLGLQPVVEW